MSTTPEQIENAKLLISEIRKALASGTKHFSVCGEPLNTLPDILEALARDGTINFKTAEATGSRNPYAESFKLPLMD